MAILLVTDVLSNTPDPPTPHSADQINCFERSTIIYIIYCNRIPTDASDFFNDFIILQDFYIYMDLLS